MQSAMRLIPGENSGSGKPANDPGKAPKHRPATVLVVEDNVLVRLDVAARLRDAGYRVIETASAEEARTAVETREPVALVFADINLPGTWQGTDLAAWLHTNFSAVKVILTSSAFHTLTGLKGCDGFLSQPYLAEEVVASVKKLVGT
jgi:CheY-like chemotaxis protein